MIGRHGVLTPEEARSKAKAVLGAVAEGAGPAAERDTARKVQTVAELCDLYLADTAAGRVLTKRDGGGNAKKVSTLATDRGRIERHIKPQLGRMPVADVTRADADIVRFRNAVAEGKRPPASRPGSTGWLGSTAARVPLPAPSACWVRSSAMRCGTEYGRTISVR